MSKMKIDSVALSDAITQRHNLPADAELLDVRMVEGVPRLSYAHDPSLDGERPREIWAIPPQVEVECVVEDLESIPTNWRVPNGVRFFENDIDDEPGAVADDSPRTTAAVTDSSGGDPSTPVAERETRTTDGETSTSPAETNPPAGDVKSDEADSETAAK